jgi:hypothetical protein
MEKHAGKIIHTIVLIHASFCVMNLMLSVWGPNFAKTAHTTQKVEQACCMLWEIVNQVDAPVRMFPHWES